MKRMLLRERKERYQAAADERYGWGTFLMLSRS